MVFPKHISSTACVPKKSLRYQFSSVLMQLIKSSRGGLVQKELGFQGTTLSVKLGKGQEGGHIQETRQAYQFLSFPCYRDQIQNKKQAESGGFILAGGSRSQSLSWGRRLGSGSLGQLLRLHQQQWSMLVLSPPLLLLRYIKPQGHGDGSPTLKVGLSPYLFPLKGPHRQTQKYVSVS